MPKNKDDDDLTRIEDLSEYEHQDSSEIDDQLDQGVSEESNQSESGHKKKSVETTEKSFHSFGGEDEGSSSEISGAHETLANNTSFSDESPSTDFNSSNELPSFETHFESEPPADTKTQIEDEEEPFALSAEDSELPEETPVSRKYEAPPPPPPQLKAKSREDFSEVREFGANLSYGTISFGGNPPFSILIKGVKYQDDADEILSLLKEHGLMGKGNDDIYRKGLENGSILVSQLSEYSAIYLAHRLRRFNFETLIGLSEELHPSKGHNKDFRGLIRKEGHLQNKAFHEDLKRADLKRENILVSTLNSLEGLQIERYIGIITVSKKIEQHEMTDSISIKNEEEHDSLGPIYQLSIQDLRDRALKLGGNGVVGISFQVLPISTSDIHDQEYQLTATGNVVWLTDRGAHGNH